MSIVRRLLAYIVDVVLLGIVINVLVFILAILNVYSLTIAFQYLVFIVVYSIYFIHMEHTKQATLGKMLLKVTISKMNFSTSMKRFGIFFIPELLYVLSILGLFNIHFIAWVATLVKIIWIAPILFRPDHKGMYEIISNTHTNSKN